MKYNTVILSEILQPKGYIRGPFGSALKRSEMLSIGVPVYEQQHAIYNNRTFRFFISEKKLEKMSRFQVKEDDLIISCSGTVGKVSIIGKDDPKGIISQALLLLRANKEKVLPRYLKYYFNSAEGYNAIISRSSGSVQVNIAKREVIENIHIPIPNIETQQKIISILTIIDEKITLNKRINDNLEQQIFALYHSKYQYPSSNNCWHDGCVGDVVTLQRGYDLPKYKIINGVYPVVGSTNTIAYHRDFTTEPPCIIVGRSGNIGKPRLYLQRCWAHNTTLFSKEFRDSNPFWVYATLCSIDYGQFRGGSAVPTLNRNHVHKYPLAIPSKKLQDEFGEFALVLYSMISKNIVQNEKLNALRNALLPKLMSGEIDVSNIDL